MSTWQLQEAKAHFSEVVKLAATEGPQQVTVRGEPAAVVISQEEYRRLRGEKPRFVQFMRASPLVDEELEFEREQSSTREIDLS
ncbi:type II toxin-antitoxin system Phd/YefM family antitoxin [Endothiovibrio diazotrophicus]